MTSILDIVAAAWPYAPLALYAFGLLLAFGWLKEASNGEATAWDIFCAIVWPATVFVVIVVASVTIPVLGIRAFWRRHHPFIAWHPVMWSLPSYRGPSWDDDRNGAES